jgi:hypothetical protein
MHIHCSLGGSVLTSIELSSLCGLMWTCSLTGLVRYTVIGLIGRHVVENSVSESPLHNGGIVNQPIGTNSGCRRM